MISSLPYQPSEFAVGFVILTAFAISTRISRPFDPRNALRLLKSIDTLSPFFAHRSRARSGTLRTVPQRPCRLLQSRQYSLDHFLATRPCRKSDHAHCSGQLTGGTEDRHCNPTV